MQIHDCPLGGAEPRPASFACFPIDNCASPIKREKSDTLHITRAFLDGMQEAAPQEIQTIHVSDRQIAFCRGCFACKHNGGRCMIDDDLRLWVSKQPAQF